MVRQNVMAAKASDREKLLTSWWPGSRKRVIEKE
jgi:hypothetical protein